MIWQNPWAWLGFGTLALPVLIHLLGRGRARVIRFPSLRFIEATRPKPLERTRIHDPWLLVVRLAILAAAVAALAEPLVQTRARKRASNDVEARVVILDTSESVRRSVVGGLDSARAVARRAQAAVRASVLVQTPNPRQVLGGAAEWLAHQPGRRGLVVVSDFQIGAIDSADIARVPHDVGIELVRLGKPRGDSVIALQAVSTAGAVDVRSVFSSGGTDVEWQRMNSAPFADRDLEVLGAATDAPTIDAIRRAALETPIPTTADSTHRIAIVLPSYERRGELLRAGEPLTEWMTDVVLRLASDSTLVMAAASDTAIASGPTGAVMARDARGAPSVVASRDGERLVLFENANAASVTSVALVAAVARAQTVTDPGELDPATVSDETLASWRRAATPAPATRAARARDESDGRWLWVIAVALLVVETWMRRERAAAREGEESRDLAA